jgi:formamidopyrimidine-DNA glycosylase
MRTTPAEPGFTFDYFFALINDPATGEKRTAKGLLTQDQLIPGLGNAIAQDILFRARLSPKSRVAELSRDRTQELYRAIVDTVREVTEKGGRYDEYDLYGQRGDYERIMDKNAVGRPCPECGGDVSRIHYLGGSCYFCPDCQG